LIFGPSKARHVRQARLVERTAQGHVVQTPRWVGDQTEEGRVVRPRPTRRDDAKEGEADVLPVCRLARSLPRRARQEGWKVLGRLSDQGRLVSSDAGEPGSTADDPRGGLKAGGRVLQGRFGKGSIGRQPQDWLAEKLKEAQEKDRHKNRVL